MRGAAGSFGAADRPARQASWRARRTSGSFRSAAVPVEEVRYGLRVHLVTLPSDPAWYTPEGLRLAGPAAFGLAGLPAAAGERRAPGGTP
ncbi:DUF917 domain-containing protein [Streptomyces sp. NBC_01591]|uniref:S-methyl thiohydantoin desulfurase domain-containing protein n=1 Tax=Streptomyces sp. NBC_01591 TaxID=2975888 RepID=UPI002DDA0711|nr:hypothetical protein [Streptomyces sp. NBC_01591]WSD67465.1 DUF917 domain-containing protein [Streptomyces sp. NBC_01591]